jgi:hypothetical protein
MYKTIRNDQTELGLHTVAAELFCKSTIKPDEHIINVKLVDVHDELKERYGKLWVTSTFRSPAANKATGGATKSQHMLGNAMDVRPASQEYFEQLRASIGSKSGAVYHELVSLGVRGFGIYDNFVHLDVRPVQDPVHWNETNLTWSQMVERAMDPDAEDVTTAVQGKALKTVQEKPAVLAYVLGALVVLWFVFRRR